MDPLCADDTSGQTVSCCADSLLSGFRDKCTAGSRFKGRVFGISSIPGYGCVRGATFAQATARCASAGGRLCTQEEIEDDCVYATGCGHSWQHLWTNSTCPDQTGLAVRKAQRLIMSTLEYQVSTSSEPKGGVRPPAAQIPSQNRPYKAVVVVYLAGGHDSYNMLVPKSNCPAKDLYAEYRAIRTNAAMNLNQLLSISVPNGTQPCGTFGVHFKLPKLKRLYDQGDLSFIANVGTLLDPITNAMTVRNGAADLPYDLFSHLTQTRQAQTVHAQHRGAKGVLGRILDVRSHTARTMPPQLHCSSLLRNMPFLRRQRTVVAAFIVRHHPWRYSPRLSLLCPPHRPCRTTPRLPSRPRTTQ
eukprot:COSAG01_NODE_871_length_13024_cov_115.041925_5_plen_358_part_00